MTSRARKVAVLMSGGVDSSLAAALLVQQGYDVTGITLKLKEIQSSKALNNSCADRSAMDALRVAEILGINHQILNIAKDFQEFIVEPFQQTYHRGHTPNPCIECNRRIKFGLVMEKARLLGMDSIATGHYARIISSASGFHLYRGIDKAKDQSYFLHALNHHILTYILFPVGHLKKTESRKLAEELNLPVAKKPESQDICFIQDGSYRDRFSESIPGLIRDTAGNILGNHPGVEHFTIGQRKGIRLSGGPYYVIAIEPSTGTLIVGGKDEGLKSRLGASRAVWHEPVSVGQEVEVKIRSRHDPSPAVVESVAEEAFSVRFKEPQWAITPGQSAVLYEGDLVLGGGIIQKAE